MQNNLRSMLTVTATALAAALLTACGSDGGGTSNEIAEGDNIIADSPVADNAVNTPWVGNWIQVNFLGDDDNGVWDQDDPTGIGFVSRITADEWIETDEYGNGCSVTYSYTVDENYKYKKIATSVSGTCPFGLNQFLNESGTLEFLDGNNIMIEHFDIEPGDTLIAFKWMRQH